MKVDPRRSASRDRGRPEVDRTVSSRESMGSSSQSSRIATPAIDRPPVRESSASSSRDYLPPPPLPSGLRPAVPVPSRRDSTSSQSSFTRPSSTGSNSFPSSSSSSNLQSSSSMSGVGSKRGAARDDLPMLAVKRPRIDYQPPLLNSKGKKIKAPAVLPPAEALKAKPHRRDSEVCPPITREQAPNILLNYVVSLHRPHVRKRHPAAHFEYVAVVEREEGTPVTPEDILKCKITLPAESPVPEKMKSATGEGTRVEGKQEAALKLAVVLWKCGEIDDEFNPVVDAEELARQTKASACLGITPYLAKVPDLWANCIKTKEPRLYPTLITFPAVPVKPPSVVVVPAPPTDQDSEESPLTLMAVEGETPPATATATAPAPTPASDVVEDASTASSPPPTEYKTPRPLLMFTRLPLPVINPGINLYFHEELSTVTFTNFDPLPLPNDEIEAIKAYSLTLIRAVVNRPMIYVDNPDGSSGEGPWYIAPVNLEWYETYRLQQEQKEEKDRQEEMKKGVKPKPDREMLDWKEMSACANETFVTWEFDDAELLEKQSVDAMATGKSEFSRRNEVLRVRRDLNPHSHPDDSPREAGSASLLEFVKTTTTQFQGLSNDSQPLLEIRKISGVLGHVRKLDKPMDATVNKLHDQKYMIPELSQRSTIAASTFLSGLYIPSITNRLEQVLLAKELNQTLFRNSLEEKRLTQALTAPSTGGETDYERLEYIGDSALKYIATTYLYVTRPGDNEHVLHDARKIIIANGSLTQNCVDSGLPHYIHARDFSVKTWYPHNLSVCRPAIMPTDRELKYQEIGDKTKADVVEAVIGAAFDAGGIESAFKTCKTLTVRVPYVDSWTQMANRLKKPASITGFSAQLRGSLPRIQEIIKYKFNNEALLCQALTVTGPNHIHFQRLEFFGDSIVDLLSVKYATSKFPSLGPGPLTHMKSAMINNHTAASFCVHLGLNEFAVFDNTLVQRAITEYVPRIKRAKEKEEELAKSEGRDPGQYWAEIDPPKLLGDVVEAVYAAILIDSGLQWKAVEDFHNNVQRLWMDKYIRGLGSLAGHPSKMLTEILQARRCMNFEIVKTLTSSLRAPALAKTEVMVHGNCLGWAIEQTPTFSSRRASEFALNAIEAEPGLLDKLCDCVWNVGAKGPKNKE
ncbi:hypothetical protein BDY24DRAFT_397668 [Mrakia frigida]|uniref:uncharacterized protein n=1 Tax=Mrakia frigida TaxID=29902 RepID=UPI003FCC07E1